ncbi:hypothetical protein ACOMHN_042860 [Nucella lapillus]
MRTPVPGDRRAGVFLALWPALPPGPLCPQSPLVGPVLPPSPLSVHTPRQVAWHAMYLYHRGHLLYLLFGVIVLCTYLYHRRYLLYLLFGVIVLCTSTTERSPAVPALWCYSAMYLYHRRYLLYLLFGVIVLCTYLYHRGHLLYLLFGVIVLPHGRVVKATDF